MAMTHPSMEKRALGLSLLLSLVRLCPIALLPHVLTPSAVRAIIKCRCVCVCVCVWLCVCVCVVVFLCLNKIK